MECSPKRGCRKDSGSLAAYAEVVSGGEVVVVVVNHANAKQAWSTHGEGQRRAESYLQTADSQTCLLPKFLGLDCHNLCLWCGGVKRSWTLLLFLCSFLLILWVSEKTRAKGSLSVTPVGRGNVVLPTSDKCTTLLCSPATIVSQQHSKTLNTKSKVMELSTKSAKELQRSSSRPYSGTAQFCQTEILALGQ